ncbi:protein ALP1-like [Senna tora]|uniref:Protein ALP1-like n=1 Tax=Senna tora TaxID=362788 RepID=A0A834U0G4_9FABA|nr:protein ALP1-like [Senna tora]
MYPSHLHSIAPSSSAQSDLHPRRSPSSASSGSTDCCAESFDLQLKVLCTMDIDNSSSESSEEDSKLEELLMINMIYEYESKFLNKVPVRTSKLTGQQFIDELIQGSGTVCYELLRMEKSCFINLCDELKRKDYLQGSRNVTLEEKVAIFLYIIGHNLRQRVVADRFQHSTQTISFYFKEVLRAICRMGQELIKQESTELPDHVKHNPLYFPWFNNCLGAIDGTHISAWAPAEKQVSCRGRKTVVTQNVLCICDFNMMFTYVYSDWEGSAHDAKVLLDALTNPEANFPWPTRGVKDIMHKNIGVEVAKLQVLESF